MTPSKAATSQAVKRGGVSARNYVLHIPAAGAFTFCGRQRKAVNCFSDSGDPRVAVNEMQCCEQCRAAWRKR